MVMNMFEYAARKKVRFESPHGALTFEQLWEVPLRVKDSKDGFHLDVVAKAANKSLKEISEESFVETARTPEHTRREITLDLVKYVIDTKLAEEKIAEQKAANKIKREKLLTILAEKQDSKLSTQSEKELRKQIDALDDE